MHWECHDCLYEIESAEFRLRRELRAEKEKNDKLETKIRKIKTLEEAITLAINNDSKEIALNLLNMLKEVIG